MAKRTKPKADPFDEYIEGVERLNDRRTVHDYLDDWKQTLTNIVSKLENGPRRPTPSQKRTAEKRIAYAQYALAMIERIEFSSDETMVFESTVQLGRMLEKLSVGPSRVSIANTKKPQAILDPEEWGKVQEFIENRTKGITITEACRQAAQALTHGRFEPLPKTRKEITESAIYKRWMNRPR